MSPAPKHSVRVQVSSILFEYTGGASALVASGSTVAAVLSDLERQHRGIRFRLIDEQDRIRPHIKIYVDGRIARRLDAPVAADSEVHVLQALSGG